MLSNQWFIYIYINDVTCEPDDHGSFVVNVVASVAKRIILHWTRSRTFYNSNFLLRAVTSKISNQLQFPFQLPFTFSHLIWSIYIEAERSAPLHFSSTTSQCVYMSLYLYWAATAMIGLLYNCIMSNTEGLRGCTIFKYIHKSFMKSLYVGR